ncbi:MULTISPECIES: aminotransferase class I/II-fold pyridoxal phosphate-dependent enzyme [unclassified Halomonas]|uniref:aminotransferase class I/II-fold pyridoxal phosphate-dependent enzyme n=1 Tax=unclassified Halomonas TaxID=2609666 RepID=UPI001C949B69|nr:MULTISPECIES: aminotransferase class I/II-fold pyridoxal phosphate-dependent enzyme [unclassified Halomonas]MBY5926531.1 aminotransferase class I/II-fold pyridoxal phosphate-dependent enzyme [Halomonas sp. DP4Y7-2]MBY6233756.1 aminotransferase class I/II-fold pyridoxal phosphate-dependent enzyme [Halomonas sp. DP4Y7-1]
MRRNDSNALKQRLLARSKDRPRGQRAAPEPGSGNSRLTRFDTLPQYQQITMMREGAERLGLKDPFFRPHDGVASATSVIEGREVINFASYNYLGLAGDPRVNEAARQALERYGTTVSASRIVSGERPIHRELERSLAQAYNCDDAVAFVSGHATNVSTLGQLLGPKDLIVHDEWIHNSAVVGAQLSGAKRMSFAHNDPEALADLLARHRQDFERVAVVIEGLYSMDGDVPDLRAFVEVKERHQAWLMVDEAHSFGVLGKHGRGLGEYAGVATDDVDIWMGTLSKSLASCGGYIAGCQALVDTLRYLAPGFLYSVGMPPQAAAPALAALTLMQQEPERLERLHHISRYFRDQAHAAGLDTGKSIGAAVVPIITGNSPAAALMSQRLFDDGINVQPIVYPAVPERSARLRFFLSSEHTTDQIDQTIDRLIYAHRALGH